MFAPLLVAYSARTICVLKGKSHKALCASERQEWICKYFWGTDLSIFMRMPEDSGAIDDVGRDLVIFNLNIFNLKEYGSLKGVAVTSLPLLRVMRYAPVDSFTYGVVFLWW